MAIAAEPTPPSHLLRSPDLTCALRRKPYGQHWQLPLDPPPPFPAPCPKPCPRLDLWTLTDSPWGRKFYEGGKQDPAQRAAWPAVPCPRWRLESGGARHLLVCFRTHPLLTSMWTGATFPRLPWPRAAGGAQSMAGVAGASRGQEGRSRAFLPLSVSGGTFGSVGTPLWHQLPWESPFLYLKKKFF